MKKILILLIITASFYGCRELSNLAEEKSPRANYEEKIRKLGVDKTLLGAGWLNAGKIALKDSILITLPYREETFFSEERVEAYGYRVNVRRGEKLIINTEKDSADSYVLFIELFELTGVGLELLKHQSDRGSILEYEADEDVELHIRIQPELLAGGRFALTVITGPTLAFPVSGKNSNAIMSVWGDSRGGGSRRHEGVDIFAPKGHPAVAAVRGVVTRTGTNNLGGKVVWISTSDYSLYYAHLDSQLVSPGSWVEPGDIVGLIGNTGNAKRTPAHLHFGIYYRGEGAVNPYHFIDNVSPELPVIASESKILGMDVTIKGVKTPLRLSPHNKADKIFMLKNGDEAKVYGIFKDWYLVNVDNVGKGYIPMQNTSYKL